MSDGAGFRPVARIIDQPLGMGVEWLEGVDYDTDPVLDDGVLLYVKDERAGGDGAR